MKIDQDPKFTTRNPELETVTRAHDLLSEACEDPDASLEEYHEAATSLLLSLLDHYVSYEKLKGENLKLRAVIKSLATVLPVLEAEIERRQLSGMTPYIAEMQIARELVKQAIRAGEEVTA